MVIIQFIRIQCQNDPKILSSHQFGSQRTTKDQSLMLKTINPVTNRKVIEENMKFYECIGYREDEKP